MIQRFGATFFVCLALSACGRVIDNPNIVYGPMTATGTLLRADVSLIRRGTHLLAVGGTAAFYVESKLSNLQDFEGQTVAVRGDLQKNSVAGELPVIVVAEIKRASGGDGLHVWNIPALNLRVTTPNGWAGTVKGKQATFLLQGETVPLLTVSLSSGSTLPQGSTFFIKNRRAVRTESRSSAIQDVYIEEKGTILSLHFDPTTQKGITSLDESRIAASAFEHLVSDLAFLSDRTDTKTPTGSGSGIFCGGVGGVLCPSGSYCEVTNAGTQEGECRQR